ncbi:hypothetical protein C2G38_2211002 [Gigaspora rosea]|uniref:BACK domain-containing protein n=1 Tax=Gigaspora rosea TaxID=44941 RepID=A0A397UMU7_9GLOM|nr:hypothetical protein C2G38_2211002 [Gigaspora rosea]
MVEPSTIFDLLVPSNKLGLEGSAEYIQSYLIDSKASWLRLKFTQALQAFCTDILENNPSLVFNSDDFTFIQENALSTLLNRDDLQMEESEIWYKVIQWGKAKTPDLPFDLKQWTEKNFLDLKTTLDKLKVKPYQQILESNLWNNITTKNMAPNILISSIILSARKKIPAQLPVRKVYFINPSSIISDEHFTEISSWTDHHSSIYNVTKIPYKFNLLLRRSRVGFTRELFHRLYNNIPRTVAIIKFNGTNEILGGYNPLHNDDSYYEKRLRSDDTNLLIDEFEDSIASS